MELTKMILISFTVNAILFFLLFSVGILPGINIVGVPFIIVGLGAINLIMLLVCLFKCKMPTFGAQPFTDYNTIEKSKHKKIKVRSQSAFPIY